MRKTALSASIAAIFISSPFSLVESHAASISLHFNCSVDYRPNPDSCGAPTGSFGTLTITDSITNPGNAVDLSWNLTPAAGMGTQVSRFLLNYESSVAPGALTFSVLGSPANYGANGWDTAVGEYGKFDIRIGFLSGALSGTGTLTAGSGGISAANFDATTDGGSPRLRALYRMNDGNGVYGAGPEPTPPAPPTPPTLVSSTTTDRVTVTESQVPNQDPILATRLTYTRADNSKVQTIIRNTLTATFTPWVRATTTTPITVDTYSDNSVVSTEGNSVVTEERYNLLTAVGVETDTFSGRVDQDEKLGLVNRSLDRSLNMDAFRRDGICLNNQTLDCNNGFRLFVNGGVSNANINDGYSANSKTYGIGTDYGVASNWRVGAQVNQVTTKMSGVDSLTQQGKVHYGLFSVYSLQGFMLVNNFGYAQNDVNSNRNIEGIFENAHSVNGRSTWLQNRLYTSNIVGVKPFVGYTFGRTERNAYTESGSILSARTVDAVRESINYAEAGLRVTQMFGKISLNGEATLASDSFKTIEVNANYAILKDVGVSVGAVRQVGNGIGGNTLSLRAVARF